jgi:hypothetical protein
MFSSVQICTKTIFGRVFFAALPWPDYLIHIFFYLVIRELAAWHTGHISFSNSSDDRLRFIAFNSYKQHIFRRQRIIYIPQQPPKVNSKHFVTIIRYCSV